VGKLLVNIEYVSPNLKCYDYYNIIAVKSRYSSMARMRSLNKSLNLFSLHVLVLQTITLDINGPQLWPVNKQAKAVVHLYQCVRDLFVFSQNKTCYIYV